LSAWSGRAHDRILRCRINAAFRSQVERRIYAAERGARRNLSCALAHDLETQTEPPVAVDRHRLRFNLVFVWRSMALKQSVSRVEMKRRMKV
jgi:hypothetical protein